MISLLPIRGDRALVIREYHIETSGLSNVLCQLIRVFCCPKYTQFREVTETRKYVGVSFTAAECDECIKMLRRELGYRVAMCSQHELFDRLVLTKRICDR